VDIDYDAELISYTDVLRRAWDVRPGDRVLDVGCGAGQTTRDAAAAAGREGSALGVDVSARAVERARELTRTAGPGNVAFECADAQTHAFPAGRFDLVISRFGTMFFADPAAAFANLGRALRPDGRLVMAVWQAADHNEWHVTIRTALGTTRSGGPDAFSLADPAVLQEILVAAGFADITFADVAAPVYYGADPAEALDWVSGFSTVQGLDLEPLRGPIAEHLGEDGVWFASRAWIVTARRI
jgi:SAM-dependent methyltransferase